MEYLGMISNKIYTSPETQFNVDLYNAFLFLENYILKEEFEKIRELTDLYNYKLFKNPSLILISFIVMKWSNFKEINVFNVRKIFSMQDISPILKENYVSIYDIVRYCRFIKLHLKNVVADFSE